MRFLSWLRSPLERKVDRVLKALNQLDYRMSKIMATVQEVLDSVTEVSGRADSAIALLVAIKAKLDAMPTGGLTPEQQAAVDAAKALSDTTSGKIQSAINENDDDPST